MPGPVAPLEQIGGQAQKPTRGKPLHIARLETGLFTQRNPLHDVADVLTYRFYGGFPDALFSGSNMEVTNKLTLGRRPGNSQWSTASYPTPPLSFYGWQRLDGTIQVIVDTAAAVYRDNQNGTKTLILTKSAGAGPAYMIGVGNFLYIGDGVDLVKFDGTNTWNWGIAAPTSAPTVNTVESGTSAIAWAANTWVSTMGIIIDANGNAQQLTSVDNGGINPNSQFGLSGNGSPVWNTITGATTTDGTVTWTCRGPIGSWKANYLFTGYGGLAATLLNPSSIYDPASGGFYENSYSVSTTSGGNRPGFTGTLGDSNTGGHIWDGGCNWVCIANTAGFSSDGTNVFTWVPNRAYGNNIFADIIITQAPPTGNQPYPSNLQPYILSPGPSGGGTSQSTPYPPNWSTLAGVQTQDNQLVWTCLGSSTWQANTSYSGWSQSNNTSFNCVKDSVGCLQVCTQTGTSGSSAPWSVWVKSTVYGVGATITDTNGFTQFCTAGGTSGSGSHPSWNTTIGGTTADNGITWKNSGYAYGTITGDGTAIWTNVGLASNATWTASQNYYLPKTGFTAPSHYDPFGGADVIDSNNKVEFVLVTGVTGATTPSWSVTTGGITSDNSSVWYNNGAILLNSLAWTKGYIYAYSFEARSSTDFYNTAVPPGLLIPLGTPTGSQSGGVSTASPFVTITGANAGAVNTISGLGPTDPQDDTIDIWRTADGGGSDQMFLLTKIPAPAPVGGVAQPWTFQDYLPDTATALYPGLNTLVPAPIDDTNDPPPAGFLPLCDDLHFERIWGAVGQFVYCSGGGDVVTGNGNESFNPNDYFEFSSPCTRLIPTATGLFNYTTSDVFAVLGGPSFTTFYPSPAIPGIGLLNYWALDIHGGVTYIFTSDKQFLSLDPSSAVSRIGAALGDQFATWDPTKVQVTHYEAGVDNCVIVADGSTGWYRLNPKQFPNGNAVWSPFATIVGGAGAVQSIETSKGVHQLLIGSETPSGSPAGYSILKRDLTTYEDNGTPYTCSFNMGAIQLCFDGQIAAVTFIAMKAANVGTHPTVSYLPQELTGSFITLPTAQSYPWQLYGTTLNPSSLLSNAYYLNQNADPALMTFMFISMAWPAENYAAELYSLTIFGSLLQDE